MVILPGAQRFADAGRVVRRGAAGGLVPDERLSRLAVAQVVARVWRDA